jgi:O-succinylbenzoic acid--CoA ligase
MKLENWLFASAAAAPERLALIAGGERLTYSQLEHRAASAARRLAGLGAGRGKRVALVLEGSAEYVVLLHALTKLGAVAVPIDPRLAGGELDSRLELAEAALVIRAVEEVSDAAEREAPLEPRVDQDFPHCVIFTSGTGGSARPVELSYGNHVWSALGSAVRIGVDARDRWLCCLPLHHIGGLAIVLRSAIYGTAVVLERFEAGAIGSLIRSEGVTLISLVGTMLARLLDAGAELDRLRCALLGGGPVQQGLIERALASGVPIAPTYGLTEAASQVTTLAPGEAGRKPGSAGTPILPAEVRISDGAILVRGPNVAAGQIGPDGWLRTGDRGRVDADGHLYVIGRGDEMIVTGGENVSPEEIEQALSEHPAVTEAGVVGREDPEWGEAVVAAVVLKEGASASEPELREFCRERLATYKVPKRIGFVERLPRDAQGKLRRKEISLPRN